MGATYYFVRCFAVLLYLGLIVAMSLEVALRRAVFVALRCVVFCSVVLCRVALRCVELHCAALLCCALFF